jgi:hypothetical protein
MTIEEKEIWGSTGGSRDLLLTRRVLTNLITSTRPVTVTVTVTLYCRSSESSHDSHQHHD